MHARFGITVLAGFAAAGVAGACSDDSAATSSTSSTSGGSPTVSADTCKSRCTAKATECKGPSALCDQLCAGSVTEGQVQCLEDKSCPELARDAQKSESLGEICPVTSTTSSSSSSASSSGSTANEIPATLKITASLPSGFKASHIKQDNQVASTFIVSEAATFEPPRPAGGPFPDLFNAKEEDVTVDSPSRNGCDSKFTFTVNSEEISVQTIAVDTLPATACATWTDKMASDGVKLTVKNVKWPNNAGKTSTVTIELK